MDIFNRVFDERNQYPENIPSYLTSTYDVTNDYQIATNEEEQRLFGKADVASVDIFDLVHSNGGFTFSEVHNDTELETQLGYSVTQTRLDPLCRYV
jgi:hypothetical protein